MGMADMNITFQSFKLASGGRVLVVVCSVCATELASCLADNIPVCDECLKTKGVPAEFPSGKIHA
jgi:hypothetical protein